eukprot:6140621-Pyramimonas_sp.AAC.1
MWVGYSRRVHATVEPLDRSHTAGASISVCCEDIAADAGERWSIRDTGVYATITLDLSGALRDEHQKNAGEHHCRSSE